MDLTKLADFNLVASHGGFGKASRASRRCKATLSRRIRRLENELGVRLIERDSHALRLTEAGMTLSTRAAPLRAEINEIAAEIANDTHRPRGVLRISVPMLFSQLFLGALAADFRARYPEIQIEATTDDRMVDLVDLVEEGYDAVIRVNPAPTTDLAGRIFMRDRYIVVVPSTFDIPDEEAMVPAMLFDASVAATP